MIDPSATAQRYLNRYQDSIRGSLSESPDGKAEGGAGRPAPTLGFAPLDDTAAQLLFRFVAAAYERRWLGIASHWPFESWGRFLPERTTAVSMLDRLLHHSHTVVTDGDSYRMRQARAKGGTRLKTN